MRVLVTGSAGLIGSEAVSFFDGLGFDVHGVDNNLRASFFGPGGDTTWGIPSARHRPSSAMKAVTDLSLSCWSGEARLMRYESCETTCRMSVELSRFLNPRAISSAMVGSFHWLGVFVSIGRECNTLGGVFDEEELARRGAGPPDFH